MKAIETKNLTYKYSVGSPFEVTAVNNVSFSVEKGDFIGIIGHTGSGKSTLIQHLNGLLKQTFGEVIIDGKNIRGKGVNIKDVRFHVGLVFQYSEHQLFEETVFKDIAFGPKNMGLSDSEVEKRVLSAANAMGIPRDWLTRSPFELSGGEKRRVALAGVLSMEPKILILDEPAAGLDPEGREQVLSKISSYHREFAVTIMLVSHSMEDIVKYAKKVLVMNKGEVRFFEETDRVFTYAEELLSIGLDLPEATKVVAALKQEGIDLGSDIYTVERLKERILARKNNEL